MLRTCQSEEFKKLSLEGLINIRKLHGIRSMLPFFNKDYGPPDLRDKLNQLEKHIGADGMKQIGIIAASHSGIVSLCRDKFFSLTAKGEKSLENLKEGKQRKIAKDLENAIKEARDMVRDSLTPIQRENLRKQCALIRLADGLDIDHTRVPAAFLTHNDARTALNDWENLKRQVVEKTEIRDGIIDISFHVAKPHRQLFEQQTKNVPRVDARAFYRLFSGKC